MRRFAAILVVTLILAYSFPTLFAAGAAAAAAAGNAAGNPAGNDGPATDTGPLGTWKLSNWSLGKGVSLSLSYRRGTSRWEWTNRQPLEQLQGLTSGQLHGVSTPVAFTLRRDAGTIAFEGNVGLGLGKGSFRFTPDPSYVSGLKSLGYESIDDDAVSLMMLAIRDVSLAYANDVKKAGLRVTEVSELVRLMDHGVEQEFIRAVGSYGQPDLTAGDAIELHDHGVDERYLAGLKKLGDRRPNVDDIVRLHDHGLSPEFVAGIHAAGYEELTTDQVIRLHDHGVDPEYVKGLRDAGYRDLATEEIVRLHDHGVDPDYVERVRVAGYGDLSVDQIIRLHEHGVD